MLEISHSGILSFPASLNLTTGGPYTYSQSGHHFYGTGYDGSYIDTRGACSGQSGSCRNNPSCQVCRTFHSVFF